MSLKSFDKFCEKMITGKSDNNDDIYSTKEIYDERQNQIRSKLTIEALVVALALSAAIVLLNDMSGWFESSFAAIAMCGAIAFLWYVIRNAAKGTLCGVKGNGVMYTGVIIALECLVYLLITLDDIGESGVIVEGRVSDQLLMLISLGIMLISAIIVLIIASKNKKHKDKE